MINPKYKTSVLFLFILLLFSSSYAQIEKAKTRPFADQKLYHLGFLVGVHAQDLIINHTGVVGANNEVWFSEIPSYTSGFTVGVIGDRYINSFMNLRFTPTFHFGQKVFRFKEQNTGQEFETQVKNNYFTFPLTMKFSSRRLNNYRPYVLAGGYFAADVSRKTNTVLRMKPIDYGLEFGVGCNFYFPLFTLCPELRFSFGLTDLVDKNRSDLTDKTLLKYTEAISTGRSRMVSLVFNFE